MNKSNYSYRELFLHPAVLVSLGAVAVIALGSALYYAHATRAPQVSALTNAATTLTLTASGLVAPAENPTLAFSASGRVTAVNAKVGAHVSQGQLLASLDTGVLAAQRAQAQAQVSAAQANLAQMLAGARPEDVAAKQTALDQANSALAQDYANAATNILGAYDKALAGISEDTDNLFTQTNSSNPMLAFATNNGQIGITAVTSRVSAENELTVWQAETSAFSPNSGTSQIEAALAASLSHLQLLRTYSNQLVMALGSATASNTFNQSAIAAGQVAVGTYQSSINALIGTLQNSSQQITSAKLAIQSAHDALLQVQAGATTQQVAAQQATIAAAQAQVQNIDAQIRNEVLIAPFSGTVASVGVKIGDAVAANTPAISLNPESALQIEVYFSEIDIEKIHTGDNAQVTLDAYGNGRAFDATVVSVDSAPSADASGQSLGYKATFQFQKSDPAITSGMTANVTIPLHD